MVDADTVIHQLYQTTRAISKDLNQRFEPEGLFSSEWSIISVLRKRGPMTQASLAGYLNIEPPAISKTLLRLEEKGLIKRETGSSRREKLVSLTALSAEKYRQWENIIAAHHADLLREIGTDDLEHFVSVLAALFKNTCRP
ncbi:MarR family winged helix-turn-helix transcriptional regulator [Telmatospirillum siberiense]|uniref:MarR family transcriptional regulator n=1 Tax=Telmatospirillum siberiense TaxID=382514 RepID=A0A2N3PP53_9PROT|nr:MarR family transcriptional regulator [Telmatospirillum siberiense]PKU22144.1 MarR family transcriptional regulator [Telmatospirillum siberiense]